MVGSIDPRCETIRGTHWPVKVAGVFGTRVAENHLGQRPPTASTGRTYGCKRSDQTMKKLLRHGGRPHMGPSVRRDDLGALISPQNVGNGITRLLRLSPIRATLAVPP